MQYLNRISTICAIILFIHTSSLSAQTQQLSKFTFNNYIESQLKCQIKLADLRWSHSLWPKQNKQAKPERQTIQTDEDILNKIENDLLMAAVYKQRFNQEISPQMLQSEINRILVATEDPQRLKQLFKALDNNPRSIAECVARPNLIQNKLISSYQWDIKNHANTRLLAQTELQKYLRGTSDETQGKIHTIEYRLQSTLTKSTELTHTKENKNIVVLAKDEFMKKLTSLINKKRIAKLKETKDAFIYEEIIEHTENSIKTNLIIWRKDNFFNWWHSLDKSTFKISIPQYQFKFKLSDNTVTNKNSHLGFSESWEYNGSGFIFKQRVYHSAVWTGNEMIIWGGSDRNFNNALNSGGLYNPVTGAWTQTNPINAPTARHSHSAVWTGTQMLIWGGMNGGAIATAGHLSNGARYDPVSDNWVSMSSIDAPVGRVFQQTVWTGNKMLIWGGYSYDNNSVVNSGGIYDEVNNSWSAINMTNAPAGRYNHTLVWANGEMIVWGGYNPFGGSKNDGSRYNLSSGQWTVTQITDAPSLRQNHSVVWTGTEMIIWGGDALNSGSPVNDGKRYNPMSNSWSPITQNNAPTARLDHIAIMADGKMLVWGGKVAGGVTLNSGGILDTNTFTWSAITDTNAPVGRTEHTAIWTGTEMIVWGGRARTGPEFNSGGRYDLTNNSWKATNLYQDPTQARTSFTSTWTGNEMIIWGGKAIGTALNTGGLYNPVTASWLVTNLTNAPSIRYQHTAIWTGVEMLVYGGTDGIFVSGSVNNLSSGSLFNPVTNVWTAIQDSTPRRLHTAVWTGGEMLLWGGFSGSAGNTTSRAVSIYNVAGPFWGTTSTSASPEPRFFHTAVWLNDEMIVWGGEGPTGSLNSGGRYNPTLNSWSLTNLSNAPSARRYQTAITTDLKMIIWGGVESNFQTHYDTGGIYDPVNDSWTATSTVNAPSPRALHSVVWTGSEMIIWAGLLSDDLNYVLYDTGARYNPSSNSWTTTTTTGVAPARFNHGSVWTGDKMLVWGGQSTATELSDLGIYSPYIPIPEEIFIDSFE